MGKILLKLKEREIFESWKESWNEMKKKIKIFQRINFSLRRFKGEKCKKKEKESFSKAL